MKPTGHILYEGPSLIAPGRIVAIAIASSDNVKTGDMLQTYILRADVAPIAASKSGADESGCGDCPRRHYLGGDCYVNLGHGPRAVFAKYVAGGYPHLYSPIDGQYEPERIFEIGRGRMVRLGAYGDPAAVPARIWEALTRHAIGHTGYTHQWLSPNISNDQRARIMALCMASADTETEAEMAHALGYRTFRARRADEPLMAREFTCPASAEAGKRLQCIDCRACDGIGRKPSAASVTIITHGARAPRVVPIHTTK